MKRFYLLTLVLLGFQALLAQGWNSTVTTTFDASAYSRLDNFANKDGIHVLLTGPSSVKYVLLSSSGTVLRQTTLESEWGDFPSITGDSSSIFAVYRKGSTTIKVQKSTNAGATWSDDAISDITSSDSYWSGVDAVKDVRGLHVCYATRPGSVGSWETYYRRNESSPDWTGLKNVTDYTDEEVGGFTTVTTSANKIHVSYNTGSGGAPTVNHGDAKSRDYDYSTWDTPQLVYGQPTGESMVERVFSDGTYLHMFYYKLVEGSPYHSDMYHTKRTVGGC